MGDKSAIQWTQGNDGSLGATWNPVLGCRKVRLVPEALTLPLRWKKPRRVFVNSMSDLFHETVPDEFLDQVFAVMARSDGTKLPGRPRVHRLLAAHTFQVLTKRPERMHRYLSDPETQYRIASTVAKAYVGFYPARGGCDWKPWTPWPLPNVHPGVSVEDQPRADERIPWLLKTPAAVRWVSYEPALDAVDFTKWLPFFWRLPGERRKLGEERAMQTNDDGSVLVQLVGGGIAVRPALDWIVVGGEAGPGARPFDLRWARAVIAQCRAAGVPVFVKQLGAFPVYSEEGGQVPQEPFGPGVEGDDAIVVLPGGRVLHRLKLRDRKGGTMDEWWFKELMVREWPKV